MKRISHIVILLLLAFGSVTCTGLFEDYNTDKVGYSEELQKMDNYWYAIPLMNLQQGIYFNYDWGAGKNWPFQIMQNLNADMFAGYFHDYKASDVSWVSNTVYRLNDSWNASMWENTYWYIVPEGKKSETRNKDAVPEFYAITLILKVELLHRISDVYGPIMYNDFGNSKLGGTPDSQQTAYYSFFDDLDEAITILHQHQNSTKFANFDFVMPAGKSTSAQWIKFANSLRLRLAIRISKVDKEKARLEAQKSLDPENGGLLEETDDVVAVSTVGTGYTNPLGEINKAWGEVIMNANMESILVGYEDPRLPRYFEPATDENYVGKYKGIRQGTGFTHGKYQNHSKSTIPQSFNALLMTSAEVWFLRAEAALRGWSSESPKECYERGIRESCTRWRVSNNYVDEYLQSDHVAADYIDAFDPEYNIEARCKVSPKWNENADNEEKLEKIITQKWIACYPEGCEAWAEQRRTGYPRLFPVLINESNGTIDTDIMIRRLNFPVNLKYSSPAQYETLCVELGGPDTGGTRLWWDTGGPNF